MFQRIKRWFRNPRPRYCTVTIDIDKPHVVVSVDWADPENLTSKEIAEEASRLAKTIMSLTNGSGAGLNEIQRAIGKNGELRKDQGMANALLASIRELCHAPRNTVNLDDRIMSPVDVFPSIG